MINTCYSLLSSQQNDDATVWGGLADGAIPLAIAEASLQFHGVTVIIVENNAAAEQLQQQILFFSPELSISVFPDWEILIYDSLSPSQTIISQRLEVLSTISIAKQAILLIPITCLLQRLAPTTFIEGYSLDIRHKKIIETDQLRRQLQKNGYHLVTTVMEHGEFSCRGSIIDLFPMGSTAPYRIELFDNEVNSIRSFDPDTQTSIQKFDQVQILPAKEFPLTEQSIARFRQHWRERFSGNPNECVVYQQISNQSFVSGIENYMPLFFDRMATIFDYLPADSQFIKTKDFNLEINTLYKTIDFRYEQRRHDRTMPLLKPEELYLSSHQIDENHAKLSTNQYQSRSFNNGSSYFRHS